MPFPIKLRNQNFLWAGAVVVLLLFGFGLFSREQIVMNDDAQSVDSLLTQYQDELMKIEGVVAVSIGQCADGTPCLKIGTSQPAEKVRELLPASLSRADVEVEFIGEIRSQ